jgi:hypothetical protein
VSDYYNRAGYPAQGASGSSSAMRAELDAIAAGFNKLPILSGNPLKIIRVNSTGTALEAVTAGAATITAADVVTTPAGNLAAVNVQASLAELDAEKVQKTGDTGSAVLPTGTTAQRDASPQNGYTRFNADTNKLETYSTSASAWVAGGGATGGSGDECFYLNSTTINNPFTIPTGYNAGTFGPVTVATGVVVTISDNSTWSIV